MYLGQTRECFYPGERFSLEPSETLFRCQGTRASVLGLSSLSLNSHALSSQPLSTACGQPFFHPHSSAPGVFKMEVMIRVRSLARIV